MFSRSAQISGQRQAAIDGQSMADHIKRMAIRQVAGVALHDVPIWMRGLGVFSVGVVYATGDHAIFLRQQFFHHSQSDTFTINQAAK
ncbi:hypothetical protein HCH_06882 [Hahella chejuensis KCTC 2396]|uniref:Uncharacterized protein n=1 Tax=Hahella chejuensis (strain KCTC 2396) TaxID=349521 RepID=Q2S775_HAHCH|nr:hypothetical protein HCH_06882 [Hahella chejuensis KCTC 2396]